MAGPLLYDRVLERTSTTGTGTLTLGGAITGYQSFAAVGNGNTCPYAIWAVNASGVPNGDWEVGIGTYTSSGTTLSRDKVLASSNSGSLVDFPGGSKRVALTPGAWAALADNDVCNGRLTTESGVPISTTDRTSQGTLYFTPYKGNRIALWNGYGWQVFTFSELSLSLTLTSGKNYDVFVNYNSGTPALALSAAWTNDTTRADAIALQDGIYCKSGTLTQRWVGTIRASGTNVTEDSGGITGTTQVGGKRFVWNAYNQVLRSMHVIDTTASWNYTTDTIRQANGASGNKCEYVTGDGAIVVSAKLTASMNGANSGRGMKVGIGVDSTSAFSGRIAYSYANGATAVSTGSPDYDGTPGLGYHYIAWCEKGGDGTSTFNGSQDASQSGMSVTLFG